MGNLGIGLIVATCFFMAIPIYALIVDPLDALRGAFSFYLMFVFGPLAAGAALVWLDLKRRRRGSPN